MSKNQLFLYSMDCLTSLNILFFHSSVNKLKEKKNSNNIVRDKGQVLKLFD